MLKSRRRPKMSVTGPRGPRVARGPWKKPPVVPQTFPSRMEQQDLLVKGRVWDLPKAYRQLARTPSHASITVVTSWDSDDKHITLYELPVLAFGACVRSSFLLGGSCFVACPECPRLGPVDSLRGRLPDTNVQSLVRQFGVEGFFSVLGFKFKEQPSFSVAFSALGVDFEFPSDRSVVVVSNRETRIAAISKMVQEALHQRRRTRHTAKSLRGRITYARAQLFGRCGAPAFKRLGAVADRTGFTTVDVELALRSLSDLVRLLQVGRPREVPAIFPSPWLLYTDGACEEASSTFTGISIGAVLFSPTGSAQFFGTEVHVGNIASCRGVDIVRRQRRSSPQRDQRVFAFTGIFQAHLGDCLLGCETGSLRVDRACTICV